MNLNKSILLFVFVFIELSITNAQNSISGTLYDAETKEALPGVNVYISDLQKGTISDNNGYYQLNNLPDGLFKIVYSFIGYATNIITVELNDTNYIQNNQLIPMAIQAQEVIITGGRTGSQHENAIKIEKFNQQNLNNTSSENLMLKLSSIPGVDAITKGDNIASPVIRGLSTSNIVLLNNGIRMENFQFSENHPYTIDESDVSSVEVIKGPASLLYGSDAVGGVLNFIKENPAPVNQTEGKFSTSYSSNNMGTNNSFRIKHSKNNIFGGLSANINSSTDYYSGGGIQVPNTRNNSKSIKIFTGYRNSNGIFRIYYDYNKLNPGVTNQASVVLITENSRENKVWYQDLDNHLLSSKNTLFFNKLKFDIDLSYQFNNRNINANPVAEPFTLVDMSLQTITWQLKMYYDLAKNNNLIIASQGLQQTNKNGNTPLHVLPDFSTHNNSLAVLWQYSPTEKTFYQAGLRYDIKQIEVPEQYSDNSNTGLTEAYKHLFDNLSFSIGFTQKLTNQFLLRMNVASAYRTPSIAELMQDGIHSSRYEIGNRNFKPQRNIEGDASLHYHADKLIVDFSAYYNYIFNYIFLAPTNDSTSDRLDIYQYQQNNAQIYGAELFTEYQPLAWLKMDASFAHVNAKQENEEYLPFIPQDKIKTNIIVEKNMHSALTKMQFAISPLIAFNQNTPHIFETETKGYFVLNSSLQAQLRFKNQIIHITLFANNIFDTEYYDHLSTLKEMGYYNMGRNINLRLIIPFSIKANKE